MPLELNSEIGTRIFFNSSDLDALGKPPTGLFDGNVAWIGNYEECMSIPNSHYCDMKNVALNLMNRTTVCVSFWLSHIMSVMSVD